MAQRRLEDERYAAFAEVSVVWLDLPDAVFRGYEGDDQLLGTPRADDPAPVDLLRREIARLEPSRVYLPLGIGGHVDHQLTRDAGMALLHDARAWVMPGPDTRTASPSTRTSPTRGGRTSAAWRTCRRARSPGCRRASR